MKNYQIRFNKPAEDTEYDWEHRSFAMGNAHMGVNLFGGVPTERLQITENSLFNRSTKWIGRHWCSGLMNFAEVYIDFPHSDISNYSRILSLNTAIATVEYDCGGVHYMRESFGSYPDNIWAIKLNASKNGALSFVLRPVSPHNCDWLSEEGDGLGRHGVCTAESDTVIQKGVADCYNISFEGIYKVVSDGTVLAQDDRLIVNGATEAVIYIAVGTNYVLDEKVFLLPDKEKLSGFEHPHEKLTQLIDNAVSKGYEKIKETHLDDYCGLFNRLSVDFGGEDDGTDTETLKKQYADGKKSAYLEELVYEMGRYVMICTSRSGCLPPNLQGIWNCFNIPPWTSGYVYNINFQMNYWQTFSSNLAECFKSFEQFNRARMKVMQRLASNYINTVMPENHSSGQGMDGWAVGSGNSPYTAGGIGGHSGPGTVGFTSKAYWDYYEFTQDIDILKNDVYPMLEGAARFYSKFAQKQDDGKYLCKISSSPEQHHEGKAYQTVGCAFDQEMMFENNRDFLKAAEILKGDPVVDEELVGIIKEQIDSYDPIQVGYSGQIKEYREEKWYGDIGESGHRHISHLVGAAPGTIINSQTPAWLDAATVSLLGRGETFVGWGNVHRMMVWARAGRDDMCEHIIDKYISGNVFYNLLGGHNPDECFQVDCVLGITAAISETLLQSHEGFLNILPSLPKRWKSGSICGILARGNTSVDIFWKNLCLDKLVLHTGCDGKCTLKYPSIQSGKLYDENGNTVNFKKESDDFISFEAIGGKVYTLTALPQFEITKSAANLQIERKNGSAVLSWEKTEDAEYFVYRAFESMPCYELIAENLKCTEYIDEGRSGRQATYKIVSKASGKKCDRGIFATVIPDTEEYKVLPDFGKGAGTFKPNNW